MAHIAKLNELSHALICSLTGRTNGDAEYKRLFDQTTKAIKSTNHNRTNPFDIRTSLTGLVEKFAILNRDDLAEGLQTRLDELPTHSKWMPETLALLLLLSDRPAEKTRIEDLEDLTKQPEILPALTWDDILADDPHDDSEIWHSIEHGYHSSGDEAIADEDDLTVSTDATSVAEDDVVALAKQYVVLGNDSAFDEMKAANQSLRDDAGAATITELCMIRETLSMLHGLPTSLYELDDKSGKVSPCRQFSIGTATDHIIGYSMAEYAEIGTSLNSLRHWVRKKQNVAFLQSCQSAIQVLLTDFATQLATLESTYISPKTNKIVSILGMRMRVEEWARPLARLSTLVSKAEKQSSISPFACLDALFDKACIAQMSNDAVLYTTLLRVFFAGLKTYLRPISFWIQTGSTDGSDPMLLAEEVKAHCELSSMWQDRFRMRTLPNGRPATPAFMQQMADRVFALGKSRAFLAALGHEGTPDELQLGSLPDFTSLLDQLHVDNLQPFADVLTITVEDWINQTAKDCTPVLCQNLLKDHGALDIFRGLTFVFCSKDSRAFQAFADTLFWRIENKLQWQDELMLTELAQTTLGSAVDPSSLSITLDPPDRVQLPSSSIAQLASLKLEMLFPPAIQNITRCASSTAYSKAFTSLIQIYHARSLLRDQFLPLRNLGTRTSHRADSVNIALKLRQSLIVFMDTLHDHITTTASTLSTNFCQALETADGVDAMVAAWTEHHKVLETSLLLGSNLKPMRNALSSLLQLCETFDGIWTGLINPRESSIETESASENTSAQGKVNALQRDFNQSLSFIANGIRSISRAGGNAALEALADRLQWNVH